MAGRTVVIRGYRFVGSERSDARSRPEAAGGQCQLWGIVRIQRSIRVLVLPLRYELTCDDIHLPELRRCKHNPDTRTGMARGRVRTPSAKHINCRGFTRTVERESRVDKWISPPKNFPGAIYGFEVTAIIFNTNLDF